MNVQKAMMRKMGRRQTNVGKKTILEEIQKSYRVRVSTIHTIRKGVDYHDHKENKT
jgi:hypothetical protein